VIRVHQLELQGFRGYPWKRTLVFPQTEGGSLLIFAPNGFGKTSITDALEFLLNEEGTLTRLGVKRGELNSGRRPLLNTQIANVEDAYVRLIFYDDSKRVDTKRAVNTESAEPFPAELKALASKTVVPFIIRGSDLRLFVEKTPLSHYEFIARCLRADKLIELQSRIRSLQTLLRKEADDDKEFKSVDKEIKAVTIGAIKKWDAPKTIEWISKGFKELRLPAPVSLEDTDDAIVDLRQKAANEASTVQRTPFEKAREAVTPFLRSDKGSPLKGIFADLESAKARQAKLTAATSLAARKKIIDEALAFFAKVTDVEECPICETPLARTQYQTLGALVERLKVLQHELGELTSIEIDIQRLKGLLEDYSGRLKAAITSAATLLSITEDKMLEQWQAVHDGILFGDESLFESFQEHLVQLKQSLDQKISAMGPGTPRVYAPMVDVISKLRQVQKRFEDATAKRQKCEAMVAQVASARNFIDKKVHNFFEDTVSAISTATISFYNKVQSCAPFPVGVKVRLMDDENQDARGVEVLVDFPNALDEKPRAILSDSQLHTLALGLQLAIIRRFNPDIPFVALDDVVTSYDADYRRQIATVLTDDMMDLQLLVLTHDDQFFLIMKSRLADFGAARWRAHRILQYSLKNGPVFSGARTPESEVEQYIKDGIPAGNAIRQHIEEWLRQLSRGIGAKFTMRFAEKPYDYSHRELVDAVIEAAGHLSLDAAMAADTSLANFVSEMKAAVIENEGSHSHENPYRRGSVGDDLSFWKDFKRFKALFSCTDKKCSGLRFRYDPTNGRASCEKCGKYLDLRPQVALATSEKSIATGST
jgi:hypothetical protein